MTIITHQNLDLDAIVGTWLLKRYGGLENAEVVFVNTGNPDQELLKLAIAVVDTGGEFNPKQRRFDHHQLPGQESISTCAARQVYEYLLSSGTDIGHLEPLILMIYAGDNGLKEYGADFSRNLGLHALLLGYKASYQEAHGTFVPDSDVLEWTFGLLDILDLRLKSQVTARLELAEKMVYQSDDGKIVAIQYGSQAASIAAQEDGAVLVVFEGKPIMGNGDEVLSYPVGIMRYGERQEPHIGNLIDQITEQIIEPAFNAELESWFKHNGGFFAGRGTGKAMDPRPVEIDIVFLAKLIDDQWQR